MGCRKRSMEKRNTKMSQRVKEEVVDYLKIDFYLIQIQICDLFLAGKFVLMVNMRSN